MFRDVWESAQFPSSYLYNNKRFEDHSCFSIVYFNLKTQHTKENDNADRDSLYIRIL